MFQDHIIIQCYLYFSFIPNEWNKVGLYVAANPLTSDDYYFEAEIVDTGLIAAIGETFEPRCEKTGLRGFRPGPTQTGLYSHRRWLEA